MTLRTASGLVAQGKILPAGCVQMLRALSHRLLLSDITMVMKFRNSRELKALLFLCVGIERVGISKIFSVWKFIGTRLHGLFLSNSCIDYCVHSFARRVIFFYLILVLTDATPFDTLSAPV